MTAPDAFYDPTRTRKAGRRYLTVADVCERYAISEWTV